MAKSITNLRRQAGMQSAAATAYEMVMRWKEGETGPQIARAMNLSPEQVKIYLRQAYRFKLIKGNQEWLRASDISELPTSSEPRGSSEVGRTKEDSGGD